jgi:hypothetical protein
MPWVGFKPAVPASERARTVHVLDRAATVTGCIYIYQSNCNLTPSDIPTWWGLRDHMTLRAMPAVV